MALQSAIDTNGKDVTQEINELLVHVKELTQLITGSPSDAVIKGDIESLAFWIGHYKTILDT